MKLLYTYFWKMLPIGTLIWLTPIWLIWAQITPPTSNRLESKMHARQTLVPSRQGAPMAIETLVGFCWYPAALPSSCKWKRKPSWCFLLLYYILFGGVARWTSNYGSWISGQRKLVACVTWLHEANKLSLWNKVQRCDLLSCTTDTFSPHVLLLNTLVFCGLFVDECWRRTSAKTRAASTDARPPWTAFFFAVFFVHLCLQARKNENGTDLAELFPDESVPVEDFRSVVDQDDTHVERYEAVFLSFDSKSIAQRSMISFATKWF